MNGARTTFMRRGYLLTALAAVVLLAASPGTASAQNPGVEFLGTAGTVREGATGGDALLVTVQATNIPAGQTVATALGTVNLIHEGAAAGAAISVVGGAAVNSGDALAFGNASRVVLSITQAVDTNWNPEVFRMRLSGGGVDVISDIFTVSVQEIHTQPVATFKPTSRKLSEGTQTDIQICVAVPQGTSAAQTPGDLVNIADLIQLMVSPADAVMDAAAAPGDTNNATAPITLTYGGNQLSHEANMPGVYNLGAINTNHQGATCSANMLTIEAIDDMTRFKNSDITISFNPSSLMKVSTAAVTDTTRPNSGDIMDGGSLSIMVESDEEPPVLSFSPTDVEIDEGGMTETVLLAEGTYGSEVGMVKLMVEGDAMVGLYMAGSDTPLEEMNGYVMVDLGSSNSARLTAKSYSDPNLMTGDTAYKAWKLVEGETDGAVIGEGSWFKVDVRGSTEVPALPLIGQLLLALFLMAGGSRLYRRRQG